MSKPFHAANKESRLVGGWLKSLGWEFIGNSGADHHRFDHPEYGLIDIACTASIPQTHAALAEIGRRMGITKPEVEVRLGLRQPKRQGPKVRRERNEAGCQARRFEVVRDEAPKEARRVGSLAERRREIVSEREAADLRLKELELAGLTDCDEYRSLLGERHRLCGELMQAEVDEKAVAA